MTIFFVKQIKSMKDADILRKSMNEEIEFRKFNNSNKQVRRGLF